MRTSPVYYVAPSDIAITPNANGKASDLSVFIAINTRIKVYDPRIADLGMVDTAFQEWNLKGRNRRLADANAPYTIYARLKKVTNWSDASEVSDAHADAYLVFAKKVQDEETKKWEDPYILSPNTSSSGGIHATGYDGQQYSWSPIPARQAGEGRANYWWIKLGDVSEPRNGQRSVTIDTGILGTEQWNTEWALNPTDLPIRLLITNSQETDVPFLRWDEHITISFTIFKGWTAHDIPVTYNVTRDTGNDSKDEEWNTAHVNIGNKLTLSHLSSNDDIAAYAAVFTVLAYDEENTLLASAAITVMGETAIEYKLVPSVSSVIYHPSTKSFTPVSYVSYQILAKDMDGSETYLTHDDILRIGAVVKMGNEDVPEYSDTGTYRRATSLWTSAEGVTLTLFISGLQADVVTLPRISDGSEGKGFENIFCRTATAAGSDDEPVFNGTPPAEITSGSVNGTATAYKNTIDAWVPDGWLSTPLTHTAAAPYTWVSKRSKTGGQWGAFSTPALFSRYAFQTVSLDLDNQLDAIARGANGKTAFARVITTHARLYLGGQLIQTGVNFSGDYGLKNSNGTYLVDAQGNRITATATTAGGVRTLVWNIPANVGCPDASYTARIVAAYNGKEYNAIFKLNVLSEGTTPEIFQLYPSADVLSFTNVNGKLTPDALTVFCGYTRINADGVTNFPGNIMGNLATSESDGNPAGQTYSAPYNIFYRLMGQTAVGSWLWARSAASSGSTPDGIITVAKDSKISGELLAAVEFVLSPAMTVKAIGDENIVDREKIPVLRDGLDGESAVMYFIQSSRRSVTIPAGSTEAHFSATLDFFKKVGNSTPTHHYCYVAAWWRGNGEDVQITDTSVFTAPTDLVDRAEIRELSTTMSTTGCVDVRATAFIIRIYSTPPVENSIPLAELEIPILKDGDNGKNGETFSITSNVQSVVIPANLTATSFSASLSFWKAVGGETKQLYPCYTTAFWRRGTSYTRISNTTYYPSYSTKRTTGTASITGLSTNNSSAVRADAIVVRIYDTATMSPSTKFLAELEIPILKDGKDGEGQKGETGKGYYYLGEWTDTSNENFIASDASFDVTKHVAPYVSVTSDGTTTYYMLVAKEGSYSRTSAGTPSASNPNWELMTTQFKYLISQAIFSDFAKLGSAIFNKDWMFSQYGLTGLGQFDTTAYKDFDRNFYNLEHSNKLYGHKSIKTGDGSVLLGSVQLTKGMQYTLATSSRRYARSASLAVYYDSTVVQGAKVTTPNDADKWEFVEESVVFTAQHSGVHEIKLEYDSDVPYSPSSGFPKTVEGSSTTPQYSNLFSCVGFKDAEYKINITGHVSSTQAKLVLRVVDPGSYNEQLGSVIEITTTSETTKSITFRPKADRGVAVQMAVVKKSSSYTGSYTGTVTMLSVSGVTDFEWAGLFANFIPKVAIDWSNGYAHFCGDRVQFNPDGSGLLAGGNIRWDANGAGLITNAYQRNNFSFITTAADFDKFTTTKKAWMEFNEYNDKPSRNIITPTPILDLDNLGQIIVVKCWDPDNAIIHLPFIAAFGEVATSFDYFYTGARTEDEFNQLSAEEMASLRRAKMRARAMLGRTIEIYNLTGVTVYLIGVYNKYLSVNNNVDMTMGKQYQVTERYALTSGRMLRFTCRRCADAAIVAYNLSSPEVIYWDVDSGAINLNADDFAPEYLIDM